MKKDRELLELAAKAAGMETQWEQPRGAKSGWLRARVPGQMAFPVWRPLDDDGDALRLACALKLNIEHGDFSARVTDEAEIDEVAFVPDESARLTITRRLIVSAAASGKPPNAEFRGRAR